MSSEVVSAKRKIVRERVRALLNEYDGLPKVDFKPREIRVVYKDKEIGSLRLPEPLLSDKVHAIYGSYPWKEKKFPSYAAAQRWFRENAEALLKEVSQ